MSTIKTTFIQHPSAESPSIELNADGTVALPLSGIGDLADVDEGSGAVDGDVLTYDGSGDVWVPQGVPVLAGIGTNVVQAAKTDVFTASASGSFATITGLTVTITPSSASSKILLVASFVSSHDDVDGASTFFRLSGGNSGTYIGDADGARARVATGYRYLTASIVDNISLWTGNITFVDSPATTSPVTYAVEGRTTNGTFTINKPDNDVSNAAVPRAASSLTAIEVAA